MAAIHSEPQVLQPKLQFGLRNSDDDFSSGERGNSNPHGGQTGLICEQCGADLPKGSTIRREFCNRKCQGAFYTAQAQVARAEARKHQACLFCRGPMRDDYPGKYYCSALCRDRSSEDVRRHRNKRNCETCGSRFLSRDKGQRFCCSVCYGASILKLHPRPCPVCNYQVQPAQDGTGDLQLCVQRHSET